jgi:hypothetical protein
MQCFSQLSCMQASALSSASRLGLSVMHEVCLQQYQASVELQVFFHAWRCAWWLGG